MTAGTFGGGPWRGARTSAVALAVALAIHALAAMAVLRFGEDWRPSIATKLEIEVNEPPPSDLRPESEPAVIPPPPPSPPPPSPPPPSPPPPSPPPPSPPPPPPVTPRVHQRRVSAREPQPHTFPPGAPAPPNQEPPPESKRNSPPPVFGVTMSSVVSGEATMAVPVGNTAMTKTLATANDRANPAPSHGTEPFVPAPETDVGTLPRPRRTVASEDVYPSEARNLGIEGKVELGVGTDENGNVVEVRLLRRAGHKFDEAAVEAMKKFLFYPARARDGRPIPYRFTYRFTFTIKD